MNAKVIAFFNNKGGVGKTTLVYHLAWMFSTKYNVLVADLDPQGNLTSAFLNEDQLDALYSAESLKETIFGCLRPLITAEGDIGEPYLEMITEKLALLPGEMSLTSFEDSLSEVWPKCLSGDIRAFRITTAFWRILQKAANRINADFIFIDLGPNLGAINRSALIASDYVVVPLSPDLFSLIGLQNLGPTLRNWRKEWGERRERKGATDFEIPLGEMLPIGYIVNRHTVRSDRPVAAYERWMNRIPDTYQKNVMCEAVDNHLTITSDPHCIASMKDYRSLMAMSQEVHKPMFNLKPADGALGAHANAVRDAFDDYRKVANEIHRRVTFK